MTPGLGFRLQPKAVSKATSMTPGLGFRLQPKALSKATSMTPLFCRLNPAQKKKITQESISFTSGTRLIIVALSKYKYKVKSMTPLL
jgi:hypothetical protein